MKILDIASYKKIDVLILTCIACVLEAVNRLLFVRLELNFTLSVMILVSLIACMRWRFAGVITAAASGAVSAWLSDQPNIQMFAVCVLGNCFVAFNYLWFVRPTAMLTKPLKLVAFVLTGFLAVAVGRSVVAALLTQQSLFPYLLTFFMQDSLNIIIACFIFLVAARQKQSILEFQPDYLVRLAKEREEELQLRHAEAISENEFYDQHL